MLFTYYICLASNICISKSIVGNAGEKCLVKVKFSQNLNLSFSLCAYYSGWMSCLISFVWASPICEERKGSKKFKIRNMSPAVFEQAAFRSVRKVTRHLGHSVTLTKILICLFCLKRVHNNDIWIKSTQCDTHVSNWLWFDAFIKSSA